ncbi:hypothetical protein HS1genome_0575 [Sulfodiicoccus acidiphilus]|uniref:Uncharacterized protein n=1 Tax=Sulfodiicoccus acidiphilus TaxID=1670455 RepID=A0A348B1Y4_9CREN|nr:hypothetical protein [Sulfodiicoccus acidiphilus]BBD72186.1 hypothetical protein HS1genome_0575 [Sulfodiicoccus acidiphilus]GGT94367.1 hypothetical protein GCM10007116_09950 [Sulfodiicoccus acidiphilus]
MYKLFEVFSIFGLMVFAGVLAGVMTMVLLGVAESEIVEALRLDRISREELRVVFILILFTIFTGVLEGSLVSTRGLLMCIEAVPYVLAITWRRLIAR